MGADDRVDTGAANGSCSGVAHGAWLVVERLLRWCIHPGLRARLLSLLGARVGREVRVYESRFMNLEQGFRNLEIGDGVHIGTDCLIDLAGPVRIARGSTLSPRVVVMSHDDPGSSQDHPLTARYPVKRPGARVGEDCWIGTGVILLAGSEVGEGCVVASGSVVRGPLDAHGLYAGAPATRRRELAATG